MLHYSVLSLRLSRMDSAQNFNKIQKAMFLQALAGASVCLSSSFFVPLLIQTIYFTTIQNCLILPIKCEFLSKCILIS